MNLSEASGVVWKTIRDWYNSMIGLAALNLLWIALSLTIVLLPPATVGVFAITNSIARGKGQQWDVFWTNARRYGWISARWALINVAVVAVFVVNMMYYGKLDNTLGVFMSIALIVVGLGWLTLQFYFWPFVIEQEQKSVRIALKNSLFLTLAEPLYTAVMVSTAALAIAISVATVLPLAVFVLSFVSLLANQATIERLTAYGKLSGVGLTFSEGDS